MNEATSTLAPLATETARAGEGQALAARSLQQAYVSIVIPCYNEEDVFPTLVARLTKEIDAWGAKAEVLFVDDGSSDQTWPLIEAQHRADPRFKGLRLGRNFGHQAALWTGLKHCAGSVIVILDADLQDPPEVLPLFFRKWSEGFDVVYAVRRNRKENPFKRLGYYGFYRILAFLADVKIPLDTGDFCVLDRRVLDAMLQTREQQPFVRGLRAWTGFQQTGLEYDRSARQAGEPKYTLRKLIQLALNGILSSSTKPLRIATYAGFAVSTLSFLGVLFTIAQRLFQAQFALIGLKPVPGFATIVCAILFLGGVQLICMGILGEYVGRIYEAVKGRPTTTLSQLLGISEDKKQG